MIYGLNFNSTEIPASIRRKFAGRRKVNGIWFYLQGVATSEEDYQTMLLVATRPGRSVIKFERNSKRGEKLIGVYCS